MNDKNRKNLESGQRCRQWTVDYVALIPAGSQFETSCNAMVAKVNQLETLAGDLEAAVSEGLSATDVKGSERLDLLDIMEPVRNAARAADQANPGTRDRYRYSNNMSHQALLASGRSFAEGGKTDETLLEGYGAPNGWMALVTAACDAYEASFGQQDSAKSSSVAKNAEFNAGVSDLTALKKTVGHMVPNFCAGNIGAIAAWTSAAHVELPPKPKAPTPPPTP